MGSRIFYLGLAETSKEIIDTWINAINEGRPLSQEEIKYIMDLQDKAILDELNINDGLSEEELQYENLANNFKDKDKMMN